MVVINEYEMVENVYNKISEHFNYTRSYKWCWVKDFIKNYSKEHILYDIGCGTGRNITNNNSEKNENHPYCIGLDNCKNFIDICNSKGLSVCLGDMLNIPFNNNSGDAVISIASFHHLSTEKRRVKCLNELKRIVKPSGKILLSVWSIKQPKKTRREFEYGDVVVPWNNKGIIYNRYYYIFRVEELTKLFKLAGLYVEKHFWDCGNEVFILHK